MQDHQFGSGRRSALIAFFEAVLITALLSYAAFSQTPKTAEEYVAAGNALVQVGHLDNAIAFYTKAIELKPDLADAYNNRGFVYQKQNKTQMAIEDFTKAIQLQPQNALYYKNRGNAYSSLNAGLAIADYQRALKLDPNDAYIWLRLGILENEMGSIVEIDNAAAHYTEAIRLKPDLVEAYLKRGALYEKRYLYDKALADINKVIQIDPDRADAYAQRASVYRWQNKYELAINDSTTAIRLKPGSAVYYYNRGYLYLRQQGVNTISDIKKAPKIDSSVIRSAIADLTKAIELDPAGTQQHIRRATAYCALGESALAAADLAKAAELGAKNLPKCP